MLITENIYKEALINPYHNEKVRDLTVITGYSDPQMVSKHFTDLGKGYFHLKLFVGMHDTTQRKHQLYQKLMVDRNFECYYAPRGLKVHSKIYRWSNDEENSINFVGSANYSQNGLINIRQNELLYRLKPEHDETINTYIEQIYNEAVLCTDPYAEELIGPRRQIPETEMPIPDGHLPGLQNGKSIRITPRNGYPGIRISQLESRREQSLGEKSALNWGQRPERDNDEAYIRVPTDAHRMDFFPLMGHYFILQDINDNNESFIAVRVSGDYGKGINSTEDNTLIGKYFKRKLNVPSGEPITLQHLLDYGKTWVDFYKVDEETFYIDF